MMRRIIAGIAALLLTLGAGWTLLAGVASAQPADAGAKYGRAYADLVKDKLKDLCPTDSGSGGDDEGSSSDESGDSGMADDGLDGPDAGSCSGIDDPKLWEAVKDCAESDPKAKSRDDLDDKAEKEFLECMAGKGFGEEPEKDEEDEESSAETEEAMANLSLARLSASLTSFYVNQLSPIGGDEAAADDDEEKKTEAAGAAVTKPDATGLAAWAHVLQQPGSAGSFVGSPDRSKQESTNWLFSASDAANVSSVNYAAFDRGKNDGAPDSGVQGYLLYGAMLSGLGFDNTMTDDGGATASRNLYGLAMMAGYAGAGFVDVAFDSVVSVLQWMNPFRFMVDAVTEHTNPTFTEGMDNPEVQEPPGALDGLREFFGDLYGVMVDVGWMVTIPMFIAVTFLGMLLLRRFDTGNNFKMLAIRIAFLVVGIPLLGTMYTAGLAAMDGASGEAAKAHATRVVLSTYVDFEGWVNGSRLQPPSSEARGSGRGDNGGEFWWNTDTNAPNGPTAAVARKLALNINSSIASRPWDSFRDEKVSKRVGESDATWGSDVMSQDPQKVAADVDDGAVFTATMELINKYRQGETVSAGAFESSIKAGLMTTLDDIKKGGGDYEGAKATMASWFQDYSSPDALGSMTKADIEKAPNPLIEVRPEASLQTGNPEDAVITFTSGESSKDACTNDRVTTVGWTGEKDKDARSKCNMSPLAMFNYLNSSFGPTSVDVYTPGQTTSSWAREAHASVSAIGSGPAQFMYWFSAMTMLASFTLIGLMYAMGMLFGVVKRSIQLIGSIPFATMGFMAAIAKVITITIAMFLEILGTILIYKVMQELIVVVPTILERPLAERLADGVSTETQVGAASAAGGVLALVGEGNLGTVVLIITAVSSIGVIMFTAMALKTRRALLDGADAAITSVVNKFTGTQVSGAMEPGQPGAVRQGVARGAGMAMTGTAMSMMRDGDGADAAGAGGDIAVDADGTAGDGGGNGNPGVPGAGDGATTVDKDGGLLDAAGNPVMGAGGQQLTAADMMPVDAQGQVTDGSGSPILGADGSPLEADDVAGFDGDGRMLGEDGQPLLDANGNELTSQPASALASQLAGDRTLAAKVLGQGGLSSLENSLGPNQSPGVPVVNQSEPQAPPAAPETTPSGVPRRVPGELHSDSVASGGGAGAALQQAAIMSATSVASQRLAGGRRSRAPEAMQVRGGKSGGGGGAAGGGGGGGGTGAVGGPPRRRKPGVVSTGMTSAATAAMMHQGGQSGQGEGTPGEGTARPPRS